MARIGLTEQDLLDLADLLHRLTDSPLSLTVEGPARVNGKVVGTILAHEDGTYRFYPGQFDTDINTTRHRERPERIL